MLKKLIIIICMCTCFYGCFDKDDHIQQKDDFQTRIAGWDYSRIPLVKPFELIRMKGFSEWLLNTSELPNEAGATGPVDLIYWSEFFIYGHQAYYQAPERKEFILPEMWFIVDIANGELREYTNEPDFLNNGIVTIEKEKMISPDACYDLLLKGESIQSIRDSLTPSSLESSP